MAFDDDEIARHLARLRVAVTSLRSMTYAAITRNERKGMPGPEGSMIKFYLADLEQELHQLAADILGPKLLQLNEDNHDWQFNYLRSYASSIGGGTTEIQKEIVADRVLGLPRGR